MLNLILDLDTGLCKPAAAPVLMAGVTVGVRLTCIRSGEPSSPGDNPAFELALGADAAPPSILAYCDTWSAENDAEFAGFLNANDTRLNAHMAAKSGATLNAELRWTVDDEAAPGGRVTQAAPHFSVAVQPPIIQPGAASEGGPVYYTEQQVNDLLATYQSLTQEDQENGKTYRLVFVNGVPSGQEI